MALGPARQKQGRRQRIAIGSRQGDVVDENVVQPRLSHRASPAARAFCAIAPQQMRIRLLLQGFD
jgi:hypothetical protein